MSREHTAELLDIEGFLSAQALPHRPLKRAGTAVWKVRAEPLDFTKPDGPLAWALSRGGELIRIPLIPYRAERDPAKAMLGAMDVIQRYTEAVPNAVRTHIILGQPIQDLSTEGEDVFRFWVGFAAKLH